MKPEAQRIAIAEACGWTLDHKGAIRADGYRSELWGKPPHEALPDYLDDLNAMHEAEKLLTEDQISNYGAFLKGKDNETVSLYAPEHREIVKVAMATATQRAEAFLKTINKWTTEQ